MKVFFFFNKPECIRQKEKRTKNLEDDIGSKKYFYRIESLKKKERDTLWSKLLRKNE